MIADLDIAALTRAACILQAVDDAGVQDIGRRLALWFEQQGHTTTSSAIARRNRLLCEAARLYFPTLSPSGQAAKLSWSLTLYRNGRWQRGECIASCCPVNLEGSIYAYAWRILRCRDLPLKARQIRKILALSRDKGPPSVAKSINED